MELNPAGGRSQVVFPRASGYGLVGMVVLGWQLDLMILEVFSNLSDSMIHILARNAQDWIEKYFDISANFLMLLQVHNEILSLVCWHWI